MRQVFGGISALALAVTFAGAGIAAEKPSRSIVEEIELAESAIRDNHIGAGLIALERAADQGSLRASLRIAEIYEEGKLVPQDRLKACQTYSSAADEYEKIDRFHPEADQVAKAFRRSAKCYAQGQDGSQWPRNMSAAASLYYHAGVILQDPKSLFELARLYLSGEGILQNTTMAIHFLDTAARKQYPPAQAMLGSMMWEGKVMKRRPESALALLMLANERASSEDRTWIIGLHDDAMITAPKAVEEQALILVEKWKSVHGVEAEMVANAAMQPDIPTPTKSPARQFGDVEFQNEADRFQNLNTNTYAPLKNDPDEKPSSRPSVK